MKNIILAGGVLLLVVVGVVWWGIGSSRQTQAEFSDGELIMEESTYDFGEIIMQDGDVMHRYLLKNGSSEPVNITEVYTSCMCTEAVVEVNGKRTREYGMPGHSPSDSDITIMPGEEAYVEAIFDPAAHGPSGVGLAERSVYLSTNSRTAPKMEMMFRAMVRR